MYGGTNFVILLTVEIRIEIASEGSIAILPIIGRLSNSLVTKLRDACDQVKGVEWAVISSRQVYKKLESHERRDL